MRFEMWEQGGSSWRWVLGLTIVLLAAPMVGTAGLSDERSDATAPAAIEGAGDGGVELGDFAWYSASELPMKLEQMGNEGTVRIAGPTGDDIVLRLEERSGDVSEERSTQWKIVDKQDKVVDEGTIRYRSYDGTVAGSATSDVYVYWDLSEFVSGVVEVDGWHATFQDEVPEVASDLDAPVIGWRQVPGSVQTSIQEERLTQPRPLDHSLGHCSSTHYSQTRYAAEDRFIQHEDDWRNWINSAHDYADPEWGDLCIDAQKFDIYGHTYNIADTTSCDPSSYNVVDAFRNHLKNSGHTTSFMDAYQLVTGLNLEGGCHGLARPSTLGGYNAASVIEGVDHCCDAYNADLQKQRGIVSAHERGHQHGSDHYNDCKDTNWFGRRTNCNIMCCDKDKALSNYDDYEAWWTQGTYDEVSSFAWGEL